MYDAKLYKELSGGFLKDQTKDIFRSCGHLLKWNQNENEEILDVGCGDGSITVNVLQKLISKNAAKYNILAVDLLDTMVHEANCNFPDEPFVKFKQANILDEQTWVTFKEKFDKVFSTQCLMAVPNPMMWVRNIYNVLKRNGQIFLTLISSHAVVKQHFYMLQQNKWSKYLENNFYNTEYLMDSDKKSWLMKHLNKGGFKNISYHHLVYDMPLKDKKSWYRFIKPLKALYKDIPHDLTETYLNEMCDNIKEEISNDQNYATISYDVIIAEK